MNQLKYILLAALCALVVSCGEKGKDDPTDTLSLSPASLSFAAKGASAQSVGVTASGAWNATPTEAWIQLSATSGSGNGSISVTVANNESEARAGKISVTCGSTSKEVFVSQVAGEKEAKAIVPQPAAFDGTKRASTTYQLLIYTFADGKGNDGVGDFQGIIDHLDYLDAMGVTALWLSPAHPTNNYHGYDVNDYAALNPTFGTEADFQNLITKAHEKGIAIYMDYVLNHSGDGNQWFIDAVNDPESEYRPYYIFSSNPKADVEAGKIAMLASEGAKAYVEGEWYAAGGKGRYHFHLDWTSDSSPKITVNKTTDDAYTGTSGKYLYFGNKKILEFKSSGENTYDLVADFESLWGYLIRTSSTSWSTGTKYGVIGRPKVTLGEPLTLSKSTSSSDPSNIPLESYYHSNFSQNMPDLNYGPVTSAETSPAFLAVASAADKWIAMGVDGLRLDAVKHIYHNSWSDENPTFLKKWYDRCGDIFMVGEVLDSHDMEKLYYKGLPSLFEFGFRDRTISGLNNAAGSTFAGAVIGFINDHKGYNPNAITSTIIGNHDISRIATELGKSEAKEKQAAAILLSAEGKPFVFQGDELGYWGDKSKHEDEDVRMPIVWDKNGSKVAKNGLPSKCDGYTDMLKGSNSVEAKSEDANSLLNVYKSWSQLRNTYPALATGSMSKTSLQGNSVASWYMTAGSQKLLVIHNLSTSGVSIAVSDPMDKPIALLGTATTKDKTLSLGPNSSVVFEL